MRPLPGDDACNAFIIVKVGLAPSNRALRKAAGGNHITATEIRSKTSWIRQLEKARKIIYEGQWNLSKSRSWEGGFAGQPSSEGRASKQSMLAELKGGSRRHWENASTLARLCFVERTRGREGEGRPLPAKCPGKSKEGDSSYVPITRKSK